MSDPNTKIPKLETKYEGAIIIDSNIEYEKIKSNIVTEYYNLVSRHIDKLNTNESRQKKLIELRTMILMSKYCDDPILIGYYKLFSNYIKNNDLN